MSAPEVSAAGPSVEPPWVLQSASRGSPVLSITELITCDPLSPGVGPQEGKRGKGWNVHIAVCPVSPHSVSDRSHTCRAQDVPKPGKGSKTSHRASPARPIRGARSLGPVRAS